MQTAKALWDPHHTERGVMLLVLSGYAQQQIASELGISEITVKVQPAT